MRTDSLSESAVGKKGRTSYKDAEAYINSADENNEAQDLIKQIKKVSKKLGGYTTVISILQALEKNK